jgi:hypothetical protein
MWIIASIPNVEGPPKVLTALAADLTALCKYEQLLQLVRQRWQQVDSRDEAIDLLPLAYGFLPRSPELGVAFSDAFDWVDTFFPQIVGQIRMLIE